MIKARSDLKSFRVNLNTTILFEQICFIISYEFTNKRIVVEHFSMEQYCLELRKIYNN